MKQTCQDAEGGWVNLGSSLNQLFGLDIFFIFEAFLETGSALCLAVKASCVHAMESERD